MEALNSAIEEYNCKKASFLHDPHGSVDLTGGEESLGDSAPVWIPDQRVSMCQLCGLQFSLVVRRHHCRACGKVLCSACSNNKAPIKYRQFEPVRVCHLCYDVLKKSKIQTSRLSKAHTVKCVLRSRGTMRIWAQDVHYFAFNISYPNILR